MHIKINLIKIILVFGIIATLATSIYFNTGFFEWIGFDLLFVWLFPIITVGMMDSTFQVAVNFFLHKRKIISIFLFIVWFIFFCASMAFTVFGMWYKMDKARINRERIAISSILISPEIEILNNQINAITINIEGYQDKYNDEENSWVAYAKIQPEIEKAKIELSRLYEEKKAILKTQSQKIKASEIGINESGELSPAIKYTIAIILDFIVDMGGCILTLFLWIFEKQKNNALAIQQKSGKQITLPHKEKSYIEYLKEYADIVFRNYDGSFNGSTKLLGFTHPAVKAAAFPLWFLNKMKTARDKGLIAVNGKATYALFSKNIFIQEMENEDKKE